DDLNRPRSDHGKSLQSSLPLSTPPPWLRRGPMIKPLSLLNQRISSNVMVELKGGRGYRGILDGFDPHMNLVLRNAEEMQDNQPQRKMDIATVREAHHICISAIRSE